MVRTRFCVALHGRLAGSEGSGGFSFSTSRQANRLCTGSRGTHLTCCTPQNPTRPYPLMHQGPLVWRFPLRCLKLLTQVCQREELRKEFKLLFHSHGPYVQGLGAFTGIMTRLLTSKANSGVVASLVCTVNIHWSRAILQRLGDQVLCWSGWKHLMCWNKDTSEFVVSGVGVWLHVTPLLVSMKALFASLF